MENAYEKHKNGNFENQKKNVPMSKGVPCRPRTDTQTDTQTE